MGAQARGLDPPITCRRGEYLAARLFRSERVVRRLASTPDPARHRLRRLPPGDRLATCAALGLPTDRPLVLFLSSAGVTDQRKGWDLLEKSMSLVRDRHPDVELVVVGPPSPHTHTSTGVPIHWRGNVSGDASLAGLYNAANVTAVPSRDDNMPLTAMEAQRCGRPVVAFAIGGLPDIVGHHETGFLAPPFDTDALAMGLIEALDDSPQTDGWGPAARERAVATWSRRPVVDQHLDVYAEAIR